MNKLHIMLSAALALLVASCGQNGPAENRGTNDSTATMKKADTAKAARTIVFFGNSLTAGYGVEPSEAFPSLIQKRIDSLKLPYRVVNAGVSGETSAGGNGRIDWILSQPVDVFVLELGGNDGLRGIPVSETKKNLQAIINKVRAKYPNVKLILCGMQIPPNMGQRYTSAFREVYPQLADSNKIELIPFLLEGVGGEARFNQQDGIHPTPEGHEILAENVWKTLEGVL